LVHSESQSFLWKGKNTKNNSKLFLDVAVKYSEFLVKYEKAEPFLEISQGQEPSEFWKLWKGEVRVEVNVEWDSAFAQAIRRDSDSEKGESSRSSEDFSGLQNRLSSSLAKHEALASEANVEVVSVRSESVEADPEE
jgi:hypothetical protein